MSRNGGGYVQQEEKKPEGDNLFGSEWLGGAFSQHMNGEEYPELEPLFKRKGADLHVKVSVPLTDTILGGEVQVPTLNGKLMLKVPPDTENGKAFKLKGKGDIITEVNMRPVHKADDLEQAISALTAGSKVSVVFLREQNTLKSDIIV